MKQWPHAPVHILEERGAYMVTCGTYLKKHHLRAPARLTLVESTLFAVADEFGWRLQAWAVLSNHYHFVALSPEDPQSLSMMLSKLHGVTAIALNKADETVGRQVWHQFWDSHITYQTSYLARLKYVHENPVHHGLVRNAEDYPWCSAAWFRKTAPTAFYKTIQGFKTDTVKVKDDFEVVGIENE